MATASHSTDNCGVFYTVKPRRKSPVPERQTEEGLKLVEHTGKAPKDMGFCLLCSHEKP